MIIVHIDLTGTYNEEMNYQENLLPRVNVSHGHKVFFITTCYQWKNGYTEETRKGRYDLLDGVHLIRIPYKRFCFGLIEKKLRIVTNLYKLLESLAPDIIMIHCIQTMECYTIIRYVKNHRDVKLFADSHTDFNNSARSFLSREVLHRFFYKPIAKKLQPYVIKFLCCSYESIFFFKKMYKIDPEKIEHFPLGGIILSDDEYKSRRARARLELGIGENDILLTHSGKMEKEKKTIELVSAFQSINKGKNIHLILIGSMDKDVSKAIKVIMEKGPNIKYLGWKKGNELINYLCACDLYCQPGSQSATMQNAACSRCALLLYPYKSHKYLWNENVVFYVRNENEIRSALLSIINNPFEIEIKRKLSYELALEKLDYNKLASRIYK